MSNHENHETQQDHKPEHEEHERNAGVAIAVLLVLGLLVLLGLVVLVMRHLLASFPPRVVSRAQGVPTSGGHASVNRVTRPELVPLRAP